MDSKTSKIDKNHGFMKSIIRNQVDRDNYDKEVKAKLETSDKNVKKISKHRKPDLQTYVPPTSRKDNSEGDANTGMADVESLKIEYEDEEGKLSELIIYKGDDPISLAEKFGASQNLPSVLVSAFKKRVLEEIAAIQSWT